MTRPIKRYRSSPNSDPFWPYVVVFVAFVLCCCGGDLIKVNYHNHIATCTIVDKDRSGSSNSHSSKYRIYTRQCGVLSNEDQWLLGKTNSADIQGQLTNGHTYRLRITGWRSPLFSTFPNIIAVEGEAAS